MALIDLTLERNSELPLGTQLAWKLRGAIVSGQLRPGDRLPGVRELAEAAGVNVNTARAVYARLADRGLIVSEHGRGTYVASVVHSQARLGELAAAAARDAQREGVDPRELAAFMYVHADAPEADVRDALRAEVEALELEVTELQHALVTSGGGSATLARPRRRGAKGARLLTTDELVATRDELAGRARALRAQVTRPRERPEQPPAAADPRGGAWPELLASGEAWTLLHPSTG